ncbi:hypothetical protein FQN57_003702 [Myotisia sp. PD_48]|nr:hypothetical protein FQN57_003702 [Myotisia sp. PD_48]
MARSKTKTCRRSPTSIPKHTHTSPRIDRTPSTPVPNRHRMNNSNSNSPSGNSPMIRLRLHTQKKGRSSPSFLSDDDSSNEGINADDEEEDNEEDTNEEEETKPEGFAPSYGGQLDHKAGLRGKGNAPVPHFQSRKKLKFEDDASVCSVSSVSSVSSVNQAGSDGSEDSEGYEGVDDISDGEDEELDLEKLEEQIILSSEFARGSTGFRSKPPNATTTDEWTGLDDLEHQPLYSIGSFFDEEHLMLQSGHSDPVADSTTLTSETTAGAPAAPRRVHFEADMSSDSDDKSSDEDDLLSDFLLQDNLDPELRRMIETDNSHAHSRRMQHGHDLFVNNDFYDIPDNIYHVEESDTSLGASSGYESDDGETTDEEDYPPPATITHPRSILRRESSASLSADPVETDKPLQQFRRRGPLRGTFVADPHKPVAVVAPNGRQLILIPPYASSRHEWLETATNSLVNTANNSPRAVTMNIMDDSDTDALVSPRHALSPMLSSNANLMMSALGNDSVGQVMGPPEAFYPTNPFSADASYDEEEDDSEAMLNVDDFIDFGDGSSDDETARELDEMEDLLSPTSLSVPGSNVTPTPMRMSVDTPQASSAEKLLDHLDRGIVTAFRRNHNRYQTLIRLPHHREFLPASSPSQTASAFKRSKLSNPRTPTRKRQASTYLGSEAVRRKLIDSHRRNTITF